MTGRPLSMVDDVDVDKKRDALVEQLKRLEWALQGAAREIAILVGNPSGNPRIKPSPLVDALTIARNLAIEHREAFRENQELTR